MYKKYKLCSKGNNNGPNRVNNRGRQNDQEKPLWIGDIWDKIIQSWGKAVQIKGENCAKTHEKVLRVLCKEAERTPAQLELSKYGEQWYQVRLKQTKESVWKAS